MCGTIDPRLTNDEYMVFLAKSGMIATWAWASAVMAGAQTARAERMAQEKAVLLAYARGEASEAAQEISLLEGELVVACQTWGTTEAKLLGLADQAAASNQLWEEAKGHCEHLVEDLTLVWLRGPELCLTVVSAPPQDLRMRECGLELAVTPRWLRSLPHSRRRCLRPLSPCLCACPLNSFRWMLRGDSCHVTGAGGAVLAS
jgi:hypothetical protein